MNDATDVEIAAACRSAAEAAAALAAASGEVTAGLLRRAAAALEDLGDELIDVADAETALGRARLEGERSRTCGQLRAFADLVSGGGHLEAIVSEATNTTPDLRRMMVPAGPVAVFGAANFPLAFSVPGGDTASALAAGCPVVAKGHPSHPKTSELCASAISRAVSEIGLPSGTFSVVQGASERVGRALVLAPEVAAVGFTGSLAGGRTLFELAATRPVPIPVYAEMGSLNPVFVSRACIEKRRDGVAAEIAGSITLGCGQFCTKPGLIFAPGDEGFVSRLAEEIESAGAARMLDERIAGGYVAALEATSALEGVSVLAGRPEPGRPMLLRTTIESFVERPELLEEHFGPAAVLVECPEPRMLEGLRRIEGVLAASVYAEGGDDDDLVASILPELVRRAGRIVFDGVPTGVAVVPAMVHGGPYPATTFPAHTSVGLSAIRRFQRPVAFQNAPPRWLPGALRGDRL